MNNPYKRNRGFTLVEILVVLAILASVVVILTRGTGDAAGHAKRRQAKMGIEALEASIKGDLAAGVYKSAQEVVRAYSNNITSGSDREKLTTDPWGKRYSVSRKSSTNTIIIKLDPSSAQANGNEDLKRDFDAKDYLD